ncbi:MAG: caspase family protein, partial [Legionellales bacterium]
MITRRALLVGYPGEKNNKHYCQGVNEDLKNYKSFLLSPLGGTWYEDEVDVLIQPSIPELRISLHLLRGHDYSLVIFTGHGYYSLEQDSTILEINKNDEIESEELMNKTDKQTVILDCCRKVERIVVSEEREILRKAVGMELDPTTCRKCYDKKIEQCDRDIIVMYACDIDEKAIDRPEGGLYSSSLLKSVQHWYQNISNNSNTNL